MELAAQLAALTGAAVTGVQPIGGQHLWRHYRATLAGGRDVFVKFSERLPPGLLRSEAAGLRWLAGPATVPVPEVIGCDEQLLVLGWVPAGPSSAAAAESFGRGLARLHAAGPAEQPPGERPPGEQPPGEQPPGEYGAPWPGFIASLPLDNTQAAGADGWPDWYATRRLLPFLRRAADAGTLTSADVSLVESVISRIGELAGPAEPPSRIHGDLWSGNLLWSGGQGWLIDPAAHCGHRETDLAMLALFGAPHLDRILAAYDEAVPLAPGWRARVPLHQLHPLLVHVCLYGTGYAAALRDAARQALTIA
jgi:fructosamine-3-kinase